MGRHKSRAGAKVLTSILSAIAVIVVVSTGLNLYSSWSPSIPSTGQTAHIDNLSWGSGTIASTDEVRERQAILYGLNEAMQNDDREAFISWGEGDGQTKLAAWWDITKSIGWDYASVDGDGWGETENPSENVSWFFSSELGATVTSLLEEEKGLILTQGEYYDITVIGMGDEAKIVSMVSSDNHFAWSPLDGQVHVSKKDNSVTVGRADEAEYVETKANQVEQVAGQAFQAWNQLGGGEQPTNGFLVQVSQNQEVLDQWVTSTYQPGIEYAGVAVTSQRPLNNQAYISPDIATGSRSSGSLMLMSPRADSDWENGYNSTLLHEMIHVLHRSAYPTGDGYGGDISGVEGFAVYAQMRFLPPGGSYYKQALDYNGYRELIVSSGYESFGSDSLRNNESANAAYVAAGLAYEYAEQNGIPAWNLALANTENPERPLGDLIYELSGGLLTDQGYREYVASRPV